MINESGKISASQASNTMTSDDLEIHFQPIISLKTSTVIGLEALARPLKKNAEAFFSEARQSSRLLKLDRRCRIRAMEAYRDLNLPRSLRHLLFLNFETSLIDKGVEGSGAMIEAPRATGLDPSDIVIELNETKVQDTVTL